HRPPAGRPPLPPVRPRYEGRRQKASPRSSDTPFATLLGRRLEFGLARRQLGCDWSRDPSARTFYGLLTNLVGSACRKTTVDQRPFPGTEGLKTAWATTAPSVTAMPNQAMGDACSATEHVHFAPENGCPLWITREDSIGERPTVVAGQSASIRAIFSVPQKSARESYTAQSGLEKPPHLLCLAR